MFRRIFLVPFEVGLCLFAIYSGISGFLDFGASNLLFVAAVHGAQIFNAIFILSGLATIYGVAVMMANVEAFGICGIMSSLIIRTMAIIATAGWTQTSHNLIAISVIFILACTVRLGMIATSAKETRLFYKT